MTNMLASSPATGASEIEAGLAAEPAEDRSIRPFRVDVPQAKLDDLRRRILATIWPERETVPDQTQGVPLATMRKLADYWATGYDWRRCEARLNAFPNFITEIDGLDIHFIHVRSRHENALPVIVTHGWPGSVVEQLKIIGPLTDPTAHGGSAEDAFDVVIPSLPGYGFSGKPATTGWDPPRIARAWATLMERLGYARFVAQGGDWGSLVTEQMGAQAPPGLLGIHTNLPSAVPAEILQALAGHTPPPGLSAEERHAFDGLDTFFGHGLAYALQMGARPQTLYALADSPVGLAAFLYDKFAAWTDSGGEPERALSRDDMLDDITLYWLTNTAISAARLYWENKVAFFIPTGVQIPVAISAFPAELYQCPRSWAERAYPRLVHYNMAAKGGHFAAWEQPDFLARELRAGFRSLRRA
jgi:pimeloyl-ACP methyl ester carboxylesterase